MAIDVQKQFLPLFQVRTDARHFQPDVPATDPYVAGHRTCAGCGPAIEYKLTLKAAGDNSISVGPTGCMYVANSSYLCTPYSIPWAHVAIASSGSFTSGVAAGYEAMIRKGKYDGEYPNVICMAGDGSASDIGLGPVSGMLYRNHDALLICYDNEQYANTGIQVSPTTPYGGSTTFTPPGEAIPEGKKLWPKQLAKMMAAGHPQAYVATASIGYAVDFMNKVRKGLNYKGAAFLHVYTPCQKGFVYETPNTIELGRLVVESGMWQMWEYDPETRTYEFFIPERMVPVIEYLKGQGRFGHLKAEHVAKLQNFCNQNWREMGVEVPAEFIRMATAEGEKDMLEAVKAAPVAATPVKVADRTKN